MVEIDFMPIPAGDDSLKMMDLDKRLILSLALHRPHKTRGYSGTSWMGPNPADLVKLEFIITMVRI